MFRERGEELRITNYELWIAKWVVAAFDDMDFNYLVRVSIESLCAPYVLVLRNLFMLPCITNVMLR